LGSQAIKLGMARLANMLMTAMVTISSVSVNPEFLRIIFISHVLSVLGQSSKFHAEPLLINPIIPSSDRKRPRMAGNITVFIINKI
jgi:hypothetical protein